MCFKKINLVINLPVKFTSYIDDLEDKNIKFRNLFSLLQ